MTAAGVRISADEVFTTDSVGEYATTELDRVQVSFDAESGYGDHCRFCGQAIEDREGGGWEWVADDESTICDDSDEEDGFHRPETGPGTWCNSASIIVDDEEDSVTCSISVGDPRGGFTFTVRKVATIYNGDGSVANPEYAGKLLLHLPYPGEGMPHMALTFDHEGTYLIGGTR